MLSTRGPSATARQARGPSAAARQAREPSAAARPARRPSAAARAPIFLGALKGLFRVPKVS